MRRLIVLVFSIAVLAAAPTFVFAEAPLPREEVARFVAPLVDGEWVNSVAVGLVSSDGSAVYGFGRLSEKDAKAPDGDTVFEIGSITKTFTGVILADMVSKGEVKLDDPVQKLLLGEVRIPQVEGVEITLKHLATHSSGLPRMPDNMKPKDAANPYADYSLEQMFAFLNGCKPARKAGEKYEYSNLAVALLGNALSRSADKIYEELFIERIAGRLGVNDTRITLSDSMQKRLAPPHTIDGEPATNWDGAAFAGAVAFRSTTNDMLKYLSANMGLTMSDLREAFALSRQEHGPISEGRAMGLGWHLNTRENLVWQNGETGGYHTYVAFSPEKKVGVVVFANTATSKVDQLGDQLLIRMLGSKATPLDLPSGAKVKEATLQRYVGKYELAPAFVITVTRKGKKLYCQATNQSKFRVFAKDDRNFAYRVVEASITFETDAAGKPERLVLHQNGRDMPGKKIE